MIFRTPSKRISTKCPKKNARGNTTLPDNLYAAIIEVEKSELVKEALGEHIFNKFIEYKKIEWHMYRTHVSKYEI